MHEIEMHQVSDAFASCWQAAGRHIQKKAQGPLRSWLKADLNPPFLEHLSFRLGNQLFFIRIEDVDEKLDLPGTRKGLLVIADGCKGHPCIMPMQIHAGGWEPARSGWGLLHARTEKSVDPVEQITDERIEMTAWEVHDFAVQTVRDHLRKAGKTLMSSQGNPAVDPSLWFVGETGPEWVVVRSARYPKMDIDRPASWSQIAEECSRLGSVGHFAPVSVASADDSFDPKGTIGPTPLWRGHALRVRFQGLIPP